MSSVIRLSFIMLTVGVLSVVMQNVVLLECRYAECCVGWRCYDDLSLY